MKKNYNLLFLWAKKVLYVSILTIISVGYVHSNPFLSLTNGEFSLIQVISEKKVTINAKNQSLDWILSEINRQAGVDYGFQDGHKINSDRLFSINVNQVTVKEALDKLLTLSDYTYIIKNGKIIIVSRNIEVEIQNSKKTAQTKFVTIRGKVVDQNNVPIVGVTIVVDYKDFNRGTISDANGDYVLILPLVDPLIINYSFVGKKTVIVKYSGKDLLNITMDDDEQLMGEVVVTGYANISKHSFTGNARTITADEIKKISPNNILQSLELLDPSFRLKLNNEMGSNPNALPELSLRGASGMGVSEYDQDILSDANLKSNPNLPTFIMDGFEVSVQKLFDMDINRIKSITILKDAAATAIYGSRAANGVVVITTITPSSGELRLTYNYTFTLQAPDLSGYNLMNSTEKLAAEKAAGLFDSNEGFHHYNQKLLMIEKGNDTDWIALPLRNTGSSKHFVRVDGGGSGLRYGLDVNYAGNNGIMKGSERKTYGANVDLQYNVNKLMFKNVTGYNVISQAESPYGNFYDFTSLNPYLSYKDELGIVNKEFDLPGDNQSTPNPMYEATLGSYNQKKIEEIYDNLSLQYFLTSKINFKANIALIRTIEDGEVYVDPQSTKFAYTDYKGELTMSKASLTSIDGGLFGYYNDVINKHHINLLAGVNVKESLTQRENYYLRDLPMGGFNNPQFAMDMTKKPSTFQETNRLFGVITSMNYTYNNIYLMDLTGRLDGNSSFGSKQRVAPFWSTGLGVNVHKYEFMKSVSWLSELKVRGSYGITGKANFPTRTARTVYTVDSDGQYATGIGATMKVLGNSNLKWEKTKISDFGFNADFFNGGLALSASYYNRQTVDLVADVSISSSSGFLLYKDNVGEVSNKGFETDFRYRAINFKNTTLYVSGSFASNKNRLVKISDSMKEYNKKIEENYSKQGNYKPMMKYVEGASISSIYAMPSLGIDPQTGEEMFIHPDGRIDNKWLAEDNIVVGNSEPKINGTISTNFYHKGFSIDIYFNYRFGGQQYNQTLRSKIENADLRKNADKRVFSDRWKTPGEPAKFKSLLKYNQDTNPTSRFVQDDNTFSLRSLSIGYNIPSATLERLKIRTAKISFNMNDVFQISSIDQERGLNYPFARSFTFSINLSM